jgi:guanylate kinase
MNYYKEQEKFLQKQSKELEKVVKSRTTELEEKVNELERFQKLTVDRELKMVELKNRIRELEAAKGRDIKPPI